MTWWMWLGLAIVGTSTEQISNRIFLSRCQQHWDYLIGYNVGALLTILLLLQPNVSHVSSSALPLLVVSGGFWFLACLFNFKADEKVEVSSTALMTQIQLVLVFCGGVYLFSEAASTLKVVGSGLVFLGISLYGGHIRQAHKVGLFFKLVAVTGGTAALLIDKRLTQLTDPAVIPVFGYLIPTLLTVLLKPKRILAGLAFSRNLGFANVALGCVGAIAYYALIRAFGATEISTIFPLYQLNLLSTLFVAHYFLNDRGAIMGKLAGSFIIIAGSLCLTL